MKKPAAFILRNLDAWRPSPARIAAAWPLLFALALLVVCGGVLIAITGRGEDAGVLSPAPMVRPDTPVVDGGAAPPPPLAVEALVPQRKLALAPAQALARNLARPTTLLNPAPPPFPGERLSPEDFAAATQCLTAAIYYEAGLEPPAGQLAVAQVVLNRLRHPLYPKTVCGVVNQGSERATGCQFTFTCDGALRRVPNPAVWRRARTMAEAALHGATSRIVGQATHYHTIWIVPVWADELRKVAIIGNHIFYRPPALYGGFASLPPAPADGAAASPEPRPEGVPVPVPATPLPLPAAPADPVSGSTDATLRPQAEAGAVAAPAQAQAPAPVASAGAAPPPPAAPARPEPSRYFGRADRRPAALPIPRGD